jgi:plasmid stabilization system protein ParE
LKPIILPAARDDILRQFRYYLVQQDKPEVAKRFLSAVRRTIEGIIRMPQGGAPKCLSLEALRGLRSWPVKGFERVATDSALLSVGSWRQDKPTLNLKQIARGYHQRQWQVLLKIMPVNYAMCRSASVPSVANQAFTPRPRRNSVPSVLKALNHRGHREKLTPGT